MKEYEIGGACGMYRGKEKCTQIGCGETWKKETIGIT